MIATSQFTISVVNDGAPGATGPQGVSVLKVVEEYRLSDSNTELTGSGTGYTWSETKPSIPSGKYLWIRERTDLSNNTSTYGTAHCDVVISGLVFDVGKNTNAITSKVWESDITTKINEYDGSTGAAIRNRVSQTETNISGITSRVSDVESETDDLGTRMTSAESSITQNANNIQSKVSQDGVISAINQSSEAILISASKVDIQGAVSFSSLDSTLQGRITGVESTASTANATANTANATANTALKGMKVYSGTCSTDAGTAAKVVSCSDTDFEMTNGTTITIKFSTASTAASPTLNVNTKGEKAIYFDGAEVSSSNIFRWQAGSVITFQYDGTHWVVMAYQNLDYFICSTAAGTTAKATNSVTGTFVLCKGTTITVFFGTSNSVNAPTLNVGSTGAYAIYYKNAVTSANNQYLWSANTTVNFTFNGSYWYVNDGGAQLAKDYAKTAVDWVGTNGTTVVSAADIMKTWTDDATLATTTIDGGYIKTHTIESTHLATNAIMSQNYSRIDTSSPYSSTGAFLDLETGTLYMPNFGVNGTTGAAYFNGTVNANAGKFGDNTSYWNIETVYDYNMQPHAALVGTGSPYLQTGNWQVSDNAVATRKYTSTSESAGNATYYKDSDSNTFYDVGMKIPTNFGGYSGSDSSVTRYNKAFYYGRKYTGNNIPSLDSDWTYFFEIDSGGNVITAGDVYEGGVKLSEKYAAITDVGSAYLPKTGGTITGNLSVNGSFTTNLMLQTNLGSTSAGQLTGNANATVTHGVTGTLGVGNGGTGKSSWTANRLIYSSASNAISELGAGSSGQVLKSNGSSAPSWVNQSDLSVGSATKATQDGDGNVITDTYRALDDNQFDTIDITDAQIGNLMVTGAARFTNGLYGDLTGNVVGNVSGSAGSVANNLKIQLNGGTTEGTNQFTYNGSATKNINITKSSIGLGNVDNTADADKSVNYAISAGSATKDSSGNTIASTYVKKTGDTFTGSLMLKATNVDASKANNNVSQVNYPTMFNIVDNGDRILSRQEAIIYDNGNIGAYWYVRNYNTSGTQVGQKGIQFIMDKTGALTYSVSDSDKFRAAIGLGSVNNTADANKAVASAGKLTNSRSFTIGNTAKNVDWSGAVSFSKEEISDNASTSAAGWMSQADKSKLDSITVTSGGTIEANNVVGTNGISVTLDKTTGIATVKHANSAITAGTASGTATSTLTNGGSFNIPTVTYDAYGHITAKGTTTLTLPNITSVSGNAGTATKFAAAQSVTLTGDTTGTASSQAGWSITTKTDRLSTVGDNRTVATKPNDYANKIIFQGLKTNSSFGSPSTDQYSYVVGLRGWEDSSGGHSHELAFNNSGISRRSGATTSWGSWVKLIDSGNYTDYTVTKTGTGATGTWGISISGNATTATSASSATNATNATYLTHKALNSTTINNTAGTFAFSGYGDPWDGCDWVGLQVGDNVDKFQISRYDTETLSGMIYRYNDSGGTNTSWTGWRRLLDEQNYHNYVVPKSGGTFTGEIISQSGGIWVQGNSAAGGNYNRFTLTSGMPTEFKYNGGKRGTKIYSNAIAFADPYNGNSNNDAGWIRHIEETVNVGTLEIATGDDSNELIKVRQYNTSSAIAHEMTLLDSSGNTAVSGKLTIGSSTSAAANTCQLVMNTSTHSLDFVFN